MAALTSNPLVNPEAFNVIIVAGVASPGVVIISGADREFSWDVKESPGTQGSTITYRGWKPTDGIQAKFLFYKAAQINEFYNSFLNLLYYDSNRALPKPVNVFHPILNANQINSVVTKKIGPLTKEDDRQLYSVTVDLLEYRPAPKKNATTTPKSSAGADPSKAAAKPSVADAQDAQIAALLEQAKKPLPD